MTCLDENTAARFMQGELRGDPARAVESHIDGCRACGALLAEVARLYVSTASSLATSSAIRPIGPHAAAYAVTSPMAPSPGSAPPPVSSHPPASEVGRYQLAGVLGAGGMGVVFAAYDPALQRRVALKLVRPDLAGTDGQGRLVREAQAAARIAHPNVVSVYDVGFVGAHVFFAMELVEGPTLRQWLAQAPRSVDAIVGVFTQLAGGLAAIHDAGLVHCDIKPDNVILGADGRARIADLGLAAANRSPTGEVGGTPAYMAPECRAGAPPSPGSDQWSFAATFFEALYGVRPPEVRSWEEMRFATRSLAGSGAGRLDSVRVPAWVESVVRRGLSPHPEWRFPSMWALGTALGSGDRSGPIHVRASLYLQGIVWGLQVLFWIFTVVNATYGTGASSSLDTTSSSSALAATAAASPDEEFGPFFTIFMVGVIAAITWGPVSIVWIPANAYALWKRRAWGRVSTLVYGLVAIFSCVGLPFGIYLVYAMTRPSVRAELDR